MVENIVRIQMNLNKTLKFLFVTVIVVLLSLSFKVSAIGPKADIQYVSYCDLDGDGAADDVYAEVLLTMLPGVNYLVFEALVKFDGEILYTIYRDNHVRTETEILYKFYFINIAFQSGEYIFKVWFDIENDGEIRHTSDTQPFDPPEGEPDHPPGGGVTPGP